MNDLSRLKEELHQAKKHWNSLEESIWEDLPLFGSQARMKIAYARLCLNHAISAGRLINDGFFTSGKALIRPCLDAYGRQLYVSYVLDEEGCSNLLQRMEKISKEYKDSEFEKLARLEDLKSVPLPYGKCLVTALKNAKLPMGVPLYSNFEDAFNNLNSATHGGLGAVMRLLTKRDVVSEPDFSTDHIGTQLTLIHLRLMSLIALLVSEERRKEAMLLHQEHQRITHETKTLLNELIGR